MNVNSIENQEIKKKFVMQNVFVNMNEVFQLLDNGIDTNYEDEIIQLLDNGIDTNYEDEIIQLYSTIDFESTYLSNTDVIGYNNEENIYYELEDEENTFESLEHIINDLNLDINYIEPLEFWAVSEYLANKLKSKGEAVQYILGHYVWGRTGSGQSIYMDGVINEITLELDLLK